MQEKPPRNPTKHAQDFALRWADKLDQYAAQRMEELGIPLECIGSSDHEHGIAWHAFNPYEHEGGGITPDGRITLDSGLFDPSLMRKFGRKADMAWRRASAKTRGDTVVAHEYEEGNGYGHNEAIVRAPDTVLPITPAARELAREIAKSLSR